MPFPFALSTTSAFSFSTSFESSSHPSLPITTSTYRGVLRDALKKHKRLPPLQQLTNLPYLVNAIESYIPYLLAIDSGLSSQTVSEEEIDVILRTTPSFEWRSTLSTSPIPGRESPRLKLHSLEYEITFTLSTYAYVQTLLARAALQPLYSVATHTPSTETRTSVIQSALKSLLLCASIHAYTSTRLSHIPSTTSCCPDLSLTVHHALSSLAHAEATLLAVLKDDPYPPAISQIHNQNDKEWMIKAPSIPKVRAMLFARICLGASEHAAKAGALLRGERSVAKIDDTLLAYIEDLRIVGRAKACRFFGVDAELGGDQGVALAWLEAGRSTLKIPSFMTPISSSSASSSKFSFRGLKNTVSTKREEARVNECADWGLDAGKAEEGRVIRYLFAKWDKMNNIVNTQVIPPYGPLLASMPTGRDFANITAWKAMQLDVGTLSGLRGVPDMDDLEAYGRGDSEDEVSAATVPSEISLDRREYAGSGGYY